PFGRRSELPIAPHRRDDRRPVRAYLNDPAGVDLPDEPEDTAGLDQLSAEDRLSAVARRLLQSFHHAVAPDGRVHRHPAATGQPVRRGCSLAQHGDRRTIEFPAALQQFARYRLWRDGALRPAWHLRSLRLLAFQGAAEG